MVDSIIFNLDESGITTLHKPGKVSTELGRKNVWVVRSGERGKTHTVLECVSASGYVTPSKGEWNLYILSASPLYAHPPNIRYCSFQVFKIPLQRKHAKS